MKVILLMNTNGEKWHYLVVNHVFYYEDLHRKILAIVCVLWRRAVVVITTAQLYSTKPELRFCAGSNPTRGISEIHDTKDL